MDFSHKKLALLFSSGSFNPPHIGHLSMFELARDYLISHGYYVLGGIMSPVGDDYKKKKPTLTCSRHRIRMVKLSVTDYPLVKCSNWEADQKNWVPAKEALEEHLAALHRVVKMTTSFFLPQISCNILISQPALAPLPRPFCQSSPRRSVLCWAAVVPEEAAVARPGRLAGEAVPATYSSLSFHSSLRHSASRVSADHLHPGMGYGFFLFVLG